MRIINQTTSQSADIDARWGFLKLEHVCEAPGGLVKVQTLRWQIWGWGTEILPGEQAQWNMLWVGVDPILLQITGMESSGSQRPQEFFVIFWRHTQQYSRLISGSALRNHF